MNSQPIVSTSGASYTDLNSLQSIRSLGRADKNQALEQIAKQFESMMVRNMMKSMRAANAVFAEGNPLNSSQSEFYQGMFDDQLALNLSEGRGMGLAELMVKQLQGRYGDAEAPAAKDQPVSALPQRPRGDNRASSGAPALAPVAANIPAAKPQASSSVAPPLQLDGEPQAFVKQLYAMAEQAACKLGVAPEVLLAQAALETGWGGKVSTDSEGRSSYNLFNIKADQRWSGDQVEVSTLEFYGAAPVREVARFRAYASPQQSFDDYADFIRNSARYRDAAQGGDAESYIRGIHRAGYATDPDYADKVLRVLNSEPMQQAVNEYRQSRTGV